MSPVPVLIAVTPHLCPRVAKALFQVLAMEGLREAKHDNAKGVIEGLLSPSAFEVVSQFRNVRSVEKKPRMPEPLDVSDLNELLARAKDR